VTLGRPGFFSTDSMEHYWTCIKGVRAAFFSLSVLLLLIETNAGCEILRVVHAVGSAKPSAS
jgi:hypothetical protein